MKFIFSIRTCFLYSVFLIPVLSFSQDSLKVIPDGTEGEVLDTVSAKTGDTKSRFRRWNLFPGKITSFKLGAGFLYEYAAYSQNQEGKQQTDSLGTTLEPQFKVRDFRFFASGQFKTKRLLTWKAGFMYDAANNEWLVRETGLMIGLPELSGNVFIGRTKEGFSLNKVMNGYAGWTMERQMAIDVIPILADGVKLLGFLPKSRLLWNLGAYTDWLSKDQTFSTYKWQFAARIGWLPIYSLPNKEQLHVGFNFRVGNPEDDAIRVRSRPEANPAPYYLDTKTFSSNLSNHVGYEIYYTKGSWMLGSEYYWHKFNSAVSGNPMFHGGELVASYILTGQSRPYSTVSGIYAFVPVTNSVFKGGLGTWEALLRFSILDLNDGIIEGGRFWRITPMVNWYLSRYVRFELAYGYGVLDRFQLKGTTQFFQSRLQLTIL